MSSLEAVAEIPASSGRLTNEAGVRTSTLVQDEQSRKAARQFEWPPELAGLAEAWRDLCDCHAGAIEHLEWVGTCLATEQSPDIVTIAEGSELLALASLARNWKRGVPRLNLTGLAEHFEPMDFVARDDNARRRLCEAVASRRLPIVLERLPAESPTIGRLQEAFGKRAVVRVSPQAAAPWIALDDSWASPESHLNSGRRSDLRRARKRAEELGPVEFQVLCPRIEQLPSLLDEAFAVEERSWKGTEGTALTRDSKRGQFFRRYAEAACRQGCLRLCFLRIAGQAVAMQIAVEQSRRFWLLKVGYDESFARCSPGMLMARETIAYAATQKLLTYEFLGKCAPWTSVWTDRQREYVRLTIYPLSIAGVAALVMDGGAVVWQKGRRAISRAPGMAKKSLRSVVHALVSRAARRYIAGAELKDAIKVRDRLDQQGLRTTLGFWDAEGDDPAAVAAKYLEALESMRCKPAHAYLSIKLPALGDSPERLNDIANKADEIGCRLHFDALTPQSVERTQKAIDGLKKRFPTLQLGYTIPGRWRRSLADADWAVSRSLAVRVVKGQFPGEGTEDVDQKRGFLDVIGRLAGKGVHVDVATHDEALLREATAILSAAQAPFAQERLYGMGTPRTPQGGPVCRIYIPYGAAYLPYAVAKLRKNPGLAVKLLVDWCRSLLRI